MDSSKIKWNGIQDPFISIIKRLGDWLISSIVVTYVHHVMIRTSLDVELGSRIFCIIILRHPHTILFINLSILSELHSTSKGEDIVVLQLWQKWKSLVAASSWGTPMDCSINLSTLSELNSTSTGAATSPLADWSQRFCMSTMVGALS